MLDYKCLSALFCVHSTLAAGSISGKRIPCISECVVHYTTFVLRCATMKPFKIEAIKTYVSYVTTFIILRNVHAQT